MPEYIPVGCNFFFCLVKNDCDDNNLIRSLIGENKKQKPVGLRIIPNQQHHLLSVLGKKSSLPCAILTWILGKWHKSQFSPYLESMKLQQLENWKLHFKISELRETLNQRFHMKRSWSEYSSARQLCFPRVSTYVLNSWENRLNVHVVGEMGRALIWCYKNDL